MTGTTNKQPISNHPAFRWAVGLWFAALLGAGLFVMPETVHATLRQSLGIDGILAGDAIGKAALAGGAALFGLLLGLVLAGRVSALNAARSYDEVEDEYEDTSWETPEVESVEEAADEPRRPFSPREFFGDDKAEEQLEPGIGEIDGADEVVIKDGAVEDASVDLAGHDPVAAQAVTTADTGPDVDDAPQDEAPLEAELEQGEDTQALGDLPLSALTQRLKRALDASRANADAPPANENGELDPVIAFLRREADRATPASHDAGGEDAQAALRSALDRLSRVSNPR